MAPSPTGNLHLGTAYTTLFNYLFAKKNNGTFILRIEDTDQERSKKEFEENIFSGLRWLGLNWDEGPFRQSERLKQYSEAAMRLLNEGKAYHCFCTPEELEDERKKQQDQKLPPIYSGKCRNLTPQEVEENLKQEKQHVVRFKMPDNRGDIIFNDLIHGEIKFNSQLLGDMVISRSDGSPLYNFAVVVDDIDMKITHVLRGDDHLSNTPKQIVIFEALNASVPEFGHWPMILNPDRIGKLSKRENATSIDDYKKDGYLPEALINYFALLGWTMPDEKEIMNLKEMEQTFDLKKMRLSGAAFNQDKLDWMNGEYIRMMSDEELEKRLQEFLIDHPAQDKLYPIIPLIKERIKKFSDFVPLTDFLFEKPEYETEVFQASLKDKQLDLSAVLQKILEKMDSLSVPWDAKEFEKTFRELAEELKLSATEMFQLIRIAISGQTATPPLFESIKILGETETKNRLQNVVSLLKKL